ncbi:SIMPL domain-containing protein [Elioraea rosea]|uniref:SIMPL domain-containing protein n=1 Tax=Elioraea rosea TaxID=2492390 RepID=UPI0013159250|nr:SIMPL domain-containing protein [Elioraea rosea]
MIRPLILAAALLSASPALAEQETLLRLSETAERIVRADQLVAVLRAQATGGSVSAVQEQVNRQVAAALERARATQGVTVSTGGYWTGRMGERRDQWLSSQDIRLSATDAAPALLELVGTLQGQGLAISRLSYDVSRPLARREREAVTAEALAGLKERAERLAGVMGMSFAGFREVRVDAGRFAMPPPMPRAMAAASAEAARTPPSAEPSEVPIAATVEGDAILKPR